MLAVVRGFRLVEDTDINNGATAFGPGGFQNENARCEKPFFRIRDEGKLKGGSGVKDGRRGGSPCLHKRGLGSAEDRGEPRRPPEGILDAAGDSHPYLRQGVEGAIAVATATERSGARITRSARMPRRPREWLYGRSWYSARKGGGDAP